MKLDIISILFIVSIVLFTSFVVQCEDYNLNMIVTKIGNESSSQFNVTCATKRNFGVSAISINTPLMTKLLVHKNLPCQNLACKSKIHKLTPNWPMVSDSTIIYDNRWEGFPIEDHLEFKLLDTLLSKKDFKVSFPFSVRSQNGFELILEERQNIAYKIRVNESSLIIEKKSNFTQFTFPFQNNQWNTYNLTLMSTVNSLEIFLSNRQQNLWKFIDQIQPLRPDNIKSEGQADWKWHSYSTAHMTRLGRTNSPIFSISSSYLFKQLYLSFCFLMCQGCGLNIYLHIQDEFPIGSIGNKMTKNGTNMFWKWKRIKFQVKQISDFSYLVFETVQMEKKSGDLFWAIDKVELAETAEDINSESSIVEISEKIPNLESINCQLVREKSFVIKWSTPSISSSDKFCSNSFLKSQCTNECEDYSTTMSTCLGVTFCSPEECFCGPGYNGTYCNELLIDVKANSIGTIFLLIFFITLLIIVLVVLLRFLCKKDGKKFQYNSQIRYESSIEKSSQVHLLEENDNATPLMIPSPEIRSEKPSRRKSGRKTQSWKPTINKNNISLMIPLEDFYDYVKNSINNGSLDKQYESLPRDNPTKTCEYGSLAQNKTKNRYGNLIAYDETRVVLEKLPNEPFSDYINANYIDGFNCKNGYIATQGPTSKTVNDFWRMIWQENVQYIVMLTNVEESGQKKCIQYWPKVNETSVYGDIAVFLENIRVFSDYVSRIFKVSFGKVDRTVEQLHFTTWPDHGVPIYPKNLVPLLQRILSVTLTSPIVVHCSAGVGRTGTIILTDICLRMATATKTIDILANLQKIRSQRSHMVNNLEQFKLVHLLIIECLLVKNTALDCSDLETDVQELFANDNFLGKQFDEIKEQMWMDQAMNLNIVFQNKGEFKTKNRFPTILPERIGVSTMGASSDDNNYINAIFVDGYRNKNQFIVTQQPMPNTLIDFWTMVIENNVTCIVSLNNLNLNDPTVAPFYPDNENIMELIPSIEMKRLSLTCFEDYDIICLLLTDKTKTQNEKSYKSIIQVKNWPFNTEIPFEQVEAFVKLWDETEKACNSYPIVVTCYDGLTASGLFVAQAFIIDKIKFEQQCDVSLAVRTIRHNRSAFIKSQEQLAYLYKAAVSYVNSFQTYSNFQK